jgi:hypothetical protein
VTSFRRCVIALGPHTVVGTEELDVWCALGFRSWSHAFKDAGIMALIDPS